MEGVVGEGACGDAAVLSFAVAAEAEGAAVEQGRGGGGVGVLDFVPVAR